MIKLVIVARCIPEDVYLQSLEAAPKQILAGEKRFSIVVRDPESWYIGRLALEIKNRYESLNFGQIKYLKDADDDCDLDPELSVADLLVDEGKAARDGADQKRIVKVIQEGGRAVRQGSVIPDLTPIHYQPPERPPVPKFPAVEKRPIQEQGADDRSAKRPRLGQIDEEGEDIVRSIEDVAIGPANAVNGARNLDEAFGEPKQESPENSRAWVNAAPATRDELECLPEAPSNWPSRAPRQGYATSAPRGDGDYALLRTAEGGNEVALNNQTPGLNQEASSHPAQQPPPGSHTETPITPPISEQAGHTPGGQAVSILNGMKSTSPSTRQPTASSAKKFRANRKDPWEFEESDIDDSQMSPHSRAARTKITPKLVHAPYAKGNNSLAATKSPSTGPKQYSAERSVEASASRQDAGGSSREIEQIPQSSHVDGSANIAADQPRNSPSWERDGFAGLPPQPLVPAKRPRQDNESVPEQSYHSFTPTTDGVRAKQSSGARAKRGNRSRSRHRSVSSLSRSRSSSVTSSNRHTTTASFGGRSQRESKFVTPVQTVEIEDRDEDDGSLDSPGAQLEETLRRSSPCKGAAKPASTGQQQRASSSQSNRSSKNAQKDILKSPETVTDDEDVPPPLKTPKRPRTKLKPSASQQPSAGELRCYRCWTKRRLCDNKEPRCTGCEKENRWCQFFRMTQAQAKQEQEDRRAGKTKPPAKSTPYAPSMPHSHASKFEDGEGSVLDTDREEGLDEANKEKSITDREEQPSSARQSSSAGNRATSRTSRSKAPKAVPAIPGNTQRNNESRDPTEEVSTERLKFTAAPAKLRSKKDKIRSTSTEIILSTQPGYQTKESALSPTVAKEVSRPGIPAQQASNTPAERLSQPLTVPPESAQARSRSPNTVLPPGMTQEEYDRLVRDRTGLTAEERKKHKSEARKGGKKGDKEKEAISPLPPVSHQTLSESASKVAQQNSAKSKKPTKTQPSQTAAAPKQSATVQSASQQKGRSSSSVPSGTAAALEARQANPTPPKTKSSSPDASNAKKSATASGKSRLANHPTIATTAGSVDSKIHTNPPFRQPQQRKGQLSNPVTAAALYQTPSIATSKSLSDMRAALSRNGSSASTPQPTSAAAKLAALKQPQQKRRFSIGNDDEDDDDSSDSDSDDETESKESAAKDAKKNAPQSEQKKVIVRQKSPSESGSDDSDSESESSDDSEKS